MSLALLDRLSKALGRRGPEPDLAWQTPVQVDQGRIGEARLAMDQEGRGLALWENDGRLWCIEHGVGSARALVRLPVATGRTPRIVMDAQGRGSSLWSAQDGDREVILGRTLGQEDPLAHTLFATGGRVQHLQAAVDRRGFVMAVWCEEREGRQAVLAQAFDPRDGAWEGSPAILGPSPAPPRGPILALNRRGHGMVLLPVADEAFTGLVCCHYWPSERIWSDRPVPVCPGRVLLHRAAMDAEGNAQALLVVEEPDGRQTLLACGYDAHRSEWGEPLPLAGGLALRGLRLAMAPDGSAFAAWSQVESGGTPRLLGRWCRRGAWDAVSAPLDPGGGTASGWAVAVTGEGRGCLLMVRGEGQGHRVVVRGLEDNAPPAALLGGWHAQPAVRPRLALGPKGGAALWVQPGAAGASLHLALGR